MACTTPPSVEAPTDRPTPGDPTPLPQYSPTRILATWASAALPMAAMAWIVAPLLAHGFAGPTALPRALILALTAGLFWQFVVVLFLVRREQGSLRWSVLKEALWLQAPRRPKGGRRGGWIWLVVVPLIIGLAAKEFLPTLPTPAARDMGLFLQSATGQTFLSSNWGWLAIILALQILNTVLGEELLFRGLLLPRMQGVFGRWDWAANGVLFALYHLHVPWVIPQTLLDSFVVAYPSKRYRSALIGIVVHSAQSLYFSILVVALVLR
ncbi:CAAX protease self-immunity [Friedmanniella luteola]|uniref:CAAX protease self-immunity n=2 Tax=Friedmanniella luteola TaxID=546871 RepID=A0A1H1VDY4_9ACTN|nr:CAAX protease self-immunity [Friedmanniella luteola]